MKKVTLIIVFFVFGLCLAGTNAQATILTFDDAVSGVNSYGFDSNSDSINDVIFSTTDPHGFGLYGPGSNMSFINEPGLEGSASLSPALKVDFLIGAVDYLKFGFALSYEITDGGATFDVYDSSDNLLASAFEYALYTYPDGTNLSDYPEGIIDVSFPGVASYALFNFDSIHTLTMEDEERDTLYIIDNFEGIFGVTEVPEPSTEVPEPSTLLLLGTGLVGLAGFRRKFQV
ncbi:MAG: PEP-CTERM sorting domain-containing protein [Deltaproteobacteria bacterium]|nr:PEP-CTERM sorting domain-containing protein [Deltaproteobacteria bacterium]